MFTEKFLMKREPLTPVISLSIAENETADTICLLTCCSVKFGVTVLVYQLLRVQTAAGAGAGGTEPSSSRTSDAAAEPLSLCTKVAAAAPARGSRGCRQRPRRPVIEKNVDPETMLLPYLRKKLRLTGTKYGCGGGGCGACTVMISRYNPIAKKIRHYPANACLTPICSLHGAAVTTVEGIGSTKARIHPVQERIAKCHGTQCGFCTPGMVMSIYTLLRNHPEPTLDQLTDALGGNLCRCTGYRPIIDTCKTFCKTSGCCQRKENGVCCLDQGVNGVPGFEEENETSPNLFPEEEFLPLDPTQELIFPPELMVRKAELVLEELMVKCQEGYLPMDPPKADGQIMAEKQPQMTRVFSGDRMTWISPVTLKELLEAKVKYPQVPVVMGNTSVGPDMKFKGVFHPVIISPDRIEELSVVNYADNGGHIVSRHLDSDLNPLLAVGNCTLNLLSKEQIPGEVSFLATEGERQIPLNEQFLRKCPSADLKPEEILVSVNIPYSRKSKGLGALSSDQGSFDSGKSTAVIEMTHTLGGIKCHIYRHCLLMGDVHKMLVKMICWLLIKQNVGPKQLPQDPIGHPIMHLSGINHATGEAIYCDDMPAVDPELFLTFVTSSRAHAKIVSLDLSEALSLPGVVDVVTEEHLRGVNSFCFLSKPEKLLETGEVSCVGQLVCAVIADSEVQAKRAAKRVKIVYQDLEPLILTIEEAIQHNSFFEEERKLECGNVDEAFKVVDQILEGEVHVGGQEHFYMETQSMLVVPKGEDQEIDVYVSTQIPKYVQDIVASTLKLPANKVMCHVKRLGGAFGGKGIKTGIMAAVTAFAANKHGCAVRCILERGEDMLITAGRHPYLGKYKAGFMKDGRILALDVEHYGNGGATLDESLLVMETGVLKVENAYKIPNLRCRARVCRTNLPSNTALRGFGFPQAGLITESCITEVAARCGLSPEKVRTINMYSEIDQTPYKQEINAKNLIQCWKECMAKSSYSLRKAAVEKFNSENYWKKKGLAIIPLKYPIGLGAVAFAQPFSRGDESSFAFVPRVGDKHSWGKSGDLVSTPGPGIKQLSQLALGPTLLECEVRRWERWPPRLLLQPLCDSVSLDPEIETGSRQAFGAPPLFGGL
ncbi:PREDICTED: aldehyde oxidase-like [Ceratotherium simum simum]|uniref:Aldehyde oxidase-like n=1 Tax=Ceratotherium simum simum TaxID=73337 RepID=A0ABM1CKM5_CERSS|nr:PREDICTED: aldehyde oxidase-like [Ceratotherium simum simum]